MKTILIVFLAVFFCHAMDPALETRVKAAWTLEEVQALAGLMNDAGKAGLPTGPLEAKTLEGLAKNAPAVKVLQAVGARKALLMEARQDGKAKNETEMRKKVFASERRVTVERMQSERKNLEIPADVPDHAGAVEIVRPPRPAAARHEARAEDRAPKQARENMEDRKPRLERIEPKEARKEEKKDIEPEQDRKMNKEERIMEKNERKEQKMERRKERERKGL